MKKQMLSEEFKRMQKIAGLITESLKEYTEEVDTLALTFKDSNEFEKAKEHFESNSDFYPYEINDEFRTFHFEVQDQVDADSTEFYLNQELEGQTDLQGYYFSTESSLNENITSISKSDFKNMIREMILAEAKKDKKEEEVDVEMDAETEEIPTEETPTEDTPEGNPDDILDSLKTALNGAKALGDEKLTDQIGNTITFYTRVHIVGQEQVTESAYDYVKTPKEYVALQLSDFFGVPKNKLMSFNLDGTDDIDALTDALNSTSTQGTEMYLKMSLESAKEHFD